MSQTRNFLIEEIKKCTDIINGTGFEYFLKNYIFLPHPTKGKVNLKESIYQWQIDAAKSFISEKFLVSEKPRQVGFSVTSGSYALYRSLFFDNQRVILLSIGQRESADLLSKIKFAYDHLPAWLQTPLTENAKTSLTFENGSKIISLPNGPNALRGQSASLIILDECAFYNMNIFSKIMAATIPAMSAGLLESFSNKRMPSQLFLVSTLFDGPVEGNDFMRILTNAKENASESKYKIIDVNVDDIPHYQDEDWHKSMRESLGERAYNIEILCKIPNSFENAFISERILNEYKNKIPLRINFLDPNMADENNMPINMDTKEILSEEDYNEKSTYIHGLHIFKEKNDELEYGIVVDIASGHGSDYSAIHVFELDSFEQVAEIKSRCDLETLKRIINKLLVFYDSPKLSLEANGIGEHLANYYDETINYEHFYYTRKSKNRYLPGFYLTSTTRQNSLAIVQSYLDRHEIKINSLRLINELKFLEYKNGKIQAPSGYNDDLAMAFAQFCYLVEAGFMVSQKVMKQNMIFGHLIDDIETEEEEKRKKGFITKQLEEKIDIIGEDNMDIEKREMVDIISNSGMSVPRDFLDNF